jgi:hypothetical protein
MTTLNKITAALMLLCCVHISCTKDFEELNTDPNRLDRVSPGTLLNPIIYGMASFNTDRAAGFTFDIMQTSLPYPSIAGGTHRYDVSDAAGNSTWNTYYRWIKNIQEMRNAAEEVEDPNYCAVAMILNAWAYSQLSDSFGDVPMNEAVRGDEGILRPAFNTQQDIYTKILADLDTANSIIVPARGMIYGSDILYNSSIDKWKRFGNSLHLRLLLRVSKRSELNSNAKLAAMINDPVTYPLFASNADNAILQITGVEPNVSPWGRAIDFTNGRAAASFFVDNLNNFNDPRRAKFITQATRFDAATKTNVPIGYRGIPSAYSGGDTQFDYNPSNMSQALIIAPMPSVVMTYAEVQFIKAELAFKGIITADAKATYESGIKAAIEQWGLTMPADYFTNVATSAYTGYDGTLNRIMLQKYYALFFTDYQQWFEYRRTGLPILPKGTSLMNNGIMPVRFRYPTTVASVNTANYRLAVESMGGDDVNTKVWWEK